MFILKVCGIDGDLLECLSIDTESVQVAQMRAMSLWERIRETEGPSHAVLWDVDEAQCFGELSRGFGFHKWRGEVP